jgi:hypothetical protein
MDRNARIMVAPSLLYRVAVATFSFDFADPKSN